MPPDRTRKASRERAERVVLARAVLCQSWKQIMRAEGFGSVGAVQSCYQREMARRQLPARDVTVQEILERRTVTTGLAVDQLMACKRAGDVSGMAAMLREIRCNDVEVAKLFGLYAPTAVEVSMSDAEFARDVAQLVSSLRPDTVRSLVAAGQLEPEVLELAGGAGDVVDAEVVEAEEEPPASAGCSAA